MQDDYIPDQILEKFNKRINIMYNYLVKVDGWRDRIKILYIGNGQYIAVSPDFDIPIHNYRSYPDLEPIMYVGDARW